MDKKQKVNKLDSVSKEILKLEDKIWQLKEEAVKLRKSINKKGALTKAEAKTFASLEEGVVFSIKKQETIDDTVVYTAVFKVTLRWEYGITCTISSSIHREHIMAAPSVKKQVDRFNKRIESFCTKMDIKYGENWVCDLGL